MYCRAELHIDPVLFPVDIYRIGVQRVFRFVQICHKIGYAARVAIFAAERSVAADDALVRQHYMHAVVEERQLFKFFGDHFEIEVGRI